MSPTPSRRTSLPLVISLLALVISLGGTSYAAVKINGNQVKAGTLPGKALKAKTVKRAKIAPDTLTGAQVKEATLGKVPAAGRADTAVQADLALDVPDGAIRAGDLGAMTTPGCELSPSPQAPARPWRHGARRARWRSPVATPARGDLLVRSSARSQTDGWFVCVANTGGARGR